MPRSSRSFVRIYAKHCGRSAARGATRAEVSKRTAVGSKDRETEVKIKVRDLVEIEKKLRDLNAERKAERVYERNVRYDDANHSLSPAGRVLRLRQDTRARLTYKEPKD